MSDIENMEEMFFSTHPEGGVRRGRTAEGARGPMR